GTCRGCALCAAASTRGLFRPAPIRRGVLPVAAVTVAAAAGVTVTVAAVAGSATVIATLIDDGACAPAHRSGGLTRVGTDVLHGLARVGTEFLDPRARALTHVANRAARAFAHVANGTPGSGTNLANRVPGARSDVLHGTARAFTDVVHRGSRTLADFLGRPAHAAGELFEDLRVAVDGRQNPVQYRRHVVQADGQLGLCLDTGDPQRDPAEFGVDADVEFEQIQHLGLQGHLGAQVLDLEADLVDPHLRNVGVDVRMFLARRGRKARTEHVLIEVVVLV